MLAIYDPRGAFSSTLSKAASTSGGRAAAVIACLSCAWGSFPDSGQARDRAGCLASSGLSPSFPEVPCASWTCVSGQSRDRTGDLRIFSPSLYQLSYLSISANVRQPVKTVNLTSRAVAPRAHLAWQPGAKAKQWTKDSATIS